MKAILKFLFFSLVAVPTFSAAQVHLPIFESVARFTMTQSSISDVCSGVKLAGNPFYQCSSLSGDARAICDALFYGAQRTYACRRFDPQVQKSQRDVCDGIYYGMLGGYNCNSLNPTLPNPQPIDFYAQENCQGIYQSRFNPNTCSKLSAMPRAVSICNYIKSWRVDNTPCRY